MPVYEVGEAEGQPFYSMALVEGGSLQQLLQRQGPLEPRTAARMMRQAAQAVQYAHDGGIVHRDIKPHNILLAARVQEGQPDLPSVPRLADFGLTNPRGRPVRHGRRSGNPQLHGAGAGGGRVHAIGPAADVYSLARSSIAC